MHVGSKHKLVKMIVRVVMIECDDSAGITMLRTQLRFCQHSSDMDDGPLRTSYIVHISFTFSLFPFPTFCVVSTTIINNYVCAW